MARYYTARTVWRSVTDLNEPIDAYMEALTREYPSCTPVPCNDCPWRRESTAGWLGPYEADKWLDIVHSDSPIACHQTIPRGGGWGPKTLQCRGAAIFRRNVAKTPRNPTVETGPRDPVTVFLDNAEFKEHHE